MASEGPEESFSWINVNGARLAYQEIGQGEPIVLVHANISDIRSWNSIKTRLAERFRVLLYSRRYHWPNEPILKDASDPWEVHADDLAALIEKIDIAPVHVLGNSTGASVALILAKRRPDLVRTLLLEEPPVISIFLPSTPPTLWEVFDFLISQPWSFLPVIMFAATVISPTMTAFQKGDDEKGLQTFARGILGNEFYAKVSTNRLEQMQVNIKPHAALFLGVGLPQFLENDARNISTPTLMITGEKTVSAHQHLNRRLAALMPGAAEFVIPHASHLSHEDNPSAVFEAIWAFLERTAPT